MWNRGALAIGTMVLLGVVLASVAVWFHHRQGQRCLELWGAEQANRIRHAPVVEALQLDPIRPSDAGQGDEDLLMVGDQRWRVVRRRDISAARGLVHARHALVVDVNFVWIDGRSPAPAAEPPQFTHAIAFREGQRQTTLLFDFASGVVQTDDGRRGVLVPQLAEAEQALLQRELASR